MLLISKRLNNADEFIAYLHRVYGRSLSSAQSIEYALEAWQVWEQQGMPYAIDAMNIAIPPFEHYQAYFDDIVNIAGLEKEQFYFILVRIQNLNAYASTLPNQDKVIVCDDKLIGFFSAFIVAVLVAVYKNPAVIEPDALEEFILKTIEQFYLGDQANVNNDRYTQSLLELIKMDFKLTEIAGYFSMAFTVFILCHELSHHLLGHTSDKALFVLNSQHPEMPVPLNNPSYEEELAADLYGFKLFLELINQSEQAKIVKLAKLFDWSPLLFFEIIQVTESFATLYGYTQLANSSHPDPIQRKQHLFKRYKKSFSAEGERLYKDLSTFIQQLPQRLNP